MSKKKQQDNEIQYPSSELLCSPCDEDYQRLLETYDKLYDKVNIALAFCGIILFVIIDGVNLKFEYEFDQFPLCLGIIINIFGITLSVISLAYCLWGTIDLLLIIKSNKVPVLDSIAIRNDKIYMMKPDQAALWLIDKYTRIIDEMRKLLNAKQKKFDKAISKIVVSIIAYVILVFIRKVI